MLKKIKIVITFMKIKKMEEEEEVTRGKQMVGKFMALPSFSNCHLDHHIITNHVINTGGKNVFSTKNIYCIYV